ncbi:uncharacterized protein LOC112169337 [Rosa chinensis]|uniref:uncharacterized protein LOC112169337 n=1 Tax=Rosa chinensis TaxID=74649 RepID=UPI001AD8EA77|nr:uncharacterized protein LOC112169337 [Rosa chinensis]
MKLEFEKCWNSGLGMIASTCGIYKGLTLMEAKNVREDLEDTMSIEDHLKNIVDKTDQLNLQEDEKLQAKQELLNKRNRSLLSHYFKPTAEQDNEKQVPTTEEPEVSLGTREKENENKSSVSKLRSRLAQIEPIRFYGKNYHIWEQQMKLYLKKLKVAYVLCQPCPTIMLGLEASPEEIVQSMAAKQKWMNDDTRCGRTILHHLSVCLFHAYSQKQKTMTAKELWKDLELKFGTEASMITTETSLVEKYIKFRILRTKSIVEQVKEFNSIFDSLFASGLVVDEKFHVNVLISKLPPSWKNVFNRLIGKEYLSSLAMVMDILRVEEGRRFMRKNLKLHS